MTYYDIYVKVRGEHGEWVHVATSHDRLEAEDEAESQECDYWQEGQNVETKIVEEPRGKRRNK